MADREPLRNRPNVLLFIGVYRSKKAPQNRPASVISLVERLTKRVRPAAKAARPATSEEA
jgi:hypothetical protein